MTVDREELGAEREFLLRSLDDLEAEREAGNIDDATYRELHDDYTARASAVIRSLDDGVDRSAAGEPPPVPLRTRVLVVGGIVAFAVVAAFLLAHAVGARRPGQTITVGVGGPVTLDPERAAAAAVSADPNSYDARVAYARAAMGARDYVTAIAQYAAANRLQPRQPEPLAYSAWISALVSGSVSDARQRAELLSTAEERVDQAIRLAPSYLDAYAFKGLILFRYENRPADAIAAFQRFLVLAPSDHPERQLVLDALAQAEQASHPSSTTT